MHAARLSLPSVLLLSLGLSSAQAQALPPSGAGVSNAYNQSFQTQNQFRGLQQQQNFDTNTNRLQNTTSRMYNNASRIDGPAVLPRGRRGAVRPERER